jgi:DNA-binding MarR family transcriptional regulator
MDMPNPLETLGLLIKRVQYRNHRAVDAELLPLGISLVQWSALRQIHRNPGCSMHDLAELTFNSDQAFGALMKRLTRQGLVERRPSKGRVTVHRLTPKGETLLDQATRIVSGALVKSFAPLSDEERGVLAALLGKLLGESGVSSS